MYNGLESAKSGQKAKTSENIYENQMSGWGEFQGVENKLITKKI